MKTCLKLNFAVALALSCLISFCMCSSSSYTHEYTDIADYGNIWSLSGRMTVRCIEPEIPSPLFPENITDPDNSEFYCYYAEHLPLGESFLIHLSVKYTDNALFDEETDRLAKIDGIVSDSQYFDNPSYATVIDWDSCFEYALIDENSRTVHYIYMQDMEIDKISVDRELLPSGYGEGSNSGSASYCSYTNEE